MAWYDPAGTYRFKVTIDNTKVEADLTLDVLITEANVPAGFWSHVKSDGADIVVTEYGLAWLLGKSIRDRARELIYVAHTDFRADLKKSAEKLYYP